MQRNHSQGLCIIFGIATFLLASCSSNDGVKNAQSYVAEVKLRPQSKVEPLPELVVFKPFAYLARDLRNPFKPTLIEQNKENGPDTDRLKQPLEAFPLDSLRMVGTLGQNERMWAIVAAPDGSVFRVTLGNYIGQNFGRVQDIKKDKIILTETVPNGTGGWSNRTSELLMVKDE